ncbi:MAG TPA: class I SAM-dependent methyltransferase [Fimbriimonadaceae bacterium]|nr:class I SAM-dependent methyltransferase [Fimbriimonadaceae bacterium]
MSTRSFLVPELLADYIDRNWITEPDVLRELRSETMATMEDPNMQISSDLGQFLTVLLKGIGARRTLEVGVFTGYSSTVTALALPEDGKLVACDVSEEFTSVARRYWVKAGVDHKIELRIGPALDTLNTLLAEGGEGQFDFAFIDADKGSYWGYFEKCLRLLRPGGLIAVDNVLWSGRVADEENQQESTIYIRDFNRRVHEDPRVVASLVPLGDGLTLAVKK